MVMFALAPLSAAQTPTAMIVPIGQLNGSI
jgi:hypothetical protein